MYYRCFFEQFLFKLTFPLTLTTRLPVVVPCSNSILNKPVDMGMFQTATKSESMLTKIFHFCLSNFCLKIVTNWTDNFRENFNHKRNKVSHEYLRWLFWELKVAVDFPKIAVVYCQKWPLWWDFVAINPNFYWDFLKLEFRNFDARGHLFSAHWKFKIRTCLF